MAATGIAPPVDAATRICRESVFAYFEPASLDRTRPGE